jgi:hypothetical protein
MANAINRLVDAASTPAFSDTTDRITCARRAIAPTVSGVSPY